MILEYKVNEFNVQPAWLKTLYELVQELDCKCKTHVEEGYNHAQKRFARTRIIEVSGDDYMLTGLKSRMDRYLRSASFPSEGDIVSELH